MVTTAARPVTQLLFLGNICAIANAINHTTHPGAGEDTPTASKDADADYSSPAPPFASIQQTGRNIGIQKNVMMASQALAKRSLAEFISSSKVTDSANAQDGSFSKKNHQHLREGGAYDDDRKLSSRTSFENIGSGPDGGQLVSFHASNSRHESIHSSSFRKLKKAGGPKSSKQTKKPKSQLKTKTSKAPKKTQVSKSQKCTNLVAEDGNWQSWLEDISNFTPIFRPVTDAELRTIIKKSKKYGCSVRMMGARHSQDGLVIQRTEEDAVVISLASHTTEVDGWHDSIDPASLTFRIGAGKSWFDVSALIRPHGFVLHSRTSGAFFSVGGVIANMVHGGGRTAEFMHDYVVKMLVLTSDGIFHEIEGDEELKYWRSSAGQLGMIVAVEMAMHSEASPFIAGVDVTGSPVIDFTKGGLAMERESTAFQTPESESEFASFLGELSSKVYETNAMYDASQFFFNFYTNSLSEYRSNFSGPRFSGAGGDFGDIEKAATYDAATEMLTEEYTDVAFTGGALLPALTADTLCAIFCVPPSGPLGDGSPCIQIPSQVVPGAKLCEVAVETNAALSIAVIDVTDEAWDACSSGPNDGYLGITSLRRFDSVVVFVPARTFAIAFSTWYVVTGQVISGKIPDLTFSPNSNLEFRFIDPQTSALLNPIPTIEELKSDYDDKYGIFFGGASAFDTLMPPLPPGVPDGWIAIEATNLRGAYTDDVSQYMFALEQAWNTMPTNPSVPYGEDVVDICDAANSIFPCAGIPTQGAKCCNPPIPAIAHLGKGWGWGYDPSITPTTGKMQPFKDTNALVNMFKESSISAFNAKRSELDAGIFAGGAMMRWLDESFPHSGFEARKLDGQMCGSPDFALTPNKECINEMCVNSICVDSEV